MAEPDLRARYFEAAHAILGSEGYGALKLAAVCRRVKVTTGAFYHTFASWQVFTDALLADWRTERTTVLAQLARSKGTPVEQLETLLDFATVLEHRVEVAIRVWSNVDPRVREVQRAVDAERYAVVLEIMRRLVGDDTAPAYARWGLNILVGFQEQSEHQTPADLEWQLRQVFELATGRRGNTGP